MRFLTEISSYMSAGNESPVYINPDEIALMCPWAERLNVFVNDGLQERRREGTEITMKSGRTFLVKETMREIQNMAQGRAKDE